MAYKELLKTFVKEDGKKERNEKVIGIFGVPTSFRMLRIFLKIGIALKSNFFIKVGTRFIFTEKTAWSLCKRPVKTR